MPPKSPDKNSVASTLSSSVDRNKDKDKDKDKDHDNDPADGVNTGTAGKNKYWFFKRSKQPKDASAEVTKLETLGGKGGVIDDYDYSSVPEDQIPLLKEQVHISKQKVTLFTMYRFVNSRDLVILLLGLFFAAVHGVALPMFTLVVGGITNNFNEYIATGALTGSEFTSLVSHNALYFVYIGIGIIGSASLESFFLVRTGESLTARYRKAYLRAIIGQNIAFFDKLGSGEVTSRIINDTTSIQEAISEKSGNIISGVATFIAAIVISFSSQWKLALILFSGEVWIIATMMICSSFMAKGIIKGESVYSTGSSVAEESLSAIRNTVAFGLQDKMVKRFDAFLQRSRKFAEQKNVALSVMLALLWSGIFWIYALAFWEGSRLIAKQEVNIGKVIVVLTSTLIGSFQLGQIAPNIQFLAKGIAACATINETINRVPVINVFDDKGERPDKVEGHIVFKDVAFRYPSRPHVDILPNFSLEVKPGETVALVGSSGSGKSTVVGLLERFYLPLAGTITLDGREISDLNIRWLRQQIGLVSQEPTLFADSIYENISYGLIGTPWENSSEEKKRERVIEACKQANAWDFIQQLTDGLDTNVGDRGFLMSGGQKQRIAIARAIISDPKILLLDEATSALDTKSEGIVQDALDRAAQSRSTIVIAHRLSTIKDASKIVVMSKGEIIEQGTHSELLALKGTYFNLVETQTVHNELSSAGAAENDELSDVDSQDCTPRPLHAPDTMQEDAFVIEDSSSTLSRSTTRLAAESKIAGLEPVPIKFKNVVGMLWKINKSEQHLIVLGALFAVALGMGYPALAMILGRTVESIMVPPSQYPTMRSRVNLYAGMFFLVGWEQLFAGFLMIRLLTYSGEQLLRGVRLSLFRQFMRMDIAFFDHSDNSSGALTTILAKDGKAIEGLGGATFGQIMNSLVMVIGGVITGISFDWRLGLVGLACVPVLVGCGFARLFILNRLMNHGRKIYVGSGAIAAQYASAVRTVQSLTREDGVQEHYGNIIDEQVRSSVWFVLQSALIYGFSEGITPWILALIFWYGSRLLSEGRIGIWAYYVVFIGIVLGSQAAGSVFSYAPDMSKAKQSSVNVLRILDAVPEIDILSQDGEPVDHSKVQGRIEFKDVRFRYPTRPQVPVLRGINLKVEQGEYIALVGGSGSGKSTAIGLIERFYNPLSGTITLDGREISSLNVNDYRNSIALVQQEPMLYSGTIRENILMGWNGAEADVTQELIEEASKEANIHDFITSLPEGYDTVVGSKGGMLSGGQKQRIAIARALIRDPKVLLLDEATSALDSESEKVVQAALDAAAKGRTTIAVAHRLSTIQDADCIYVFDRGHIVEKGKHDELLALNGQYAELVRLQSLES